jgi:hypothetical protein
MIKRISIGLLLVTGFAVQAQTVNVRGKISNPAGQAVSGAVVELALRKLKDTTGSDGMYSLTGTTGIGRHPLPSIEHLALNGGFLDLFLSRSQPVKLEVFDVRGNLLKREVEANAPAGAHRWNLSEHVTPDNMLLVKASVGGQARTFRYLPLIGAGYVAQRPASEGAPMAARLAKAAADLDTLAVTAAGFTTKKVPISNYDSLLNVSLSNGPVGGEPSPGCGNTAAPKGARTLTIQLNGRARTHVLFVPNGYDPKKPIPLIFAWHSSGASGTESRGYYKLEAATGDGAIITYPNGLNGGWDLAAEGVDVKFFDALLESISKDYCVDQSRLYSTGYSFGGMMSFTLACSRGAKLRGFAPMAGSFRGGGSTGCATAVPGWIAHATNDNLVSYSSGQAARDVWIKTNGCSATTTPTSPSPCVAYTCTKAPLHWCSHTQGHEWPNFASKGLWTFFQSL